MRKEQQANCLEIMVDRIRKREGKIEILTKTKPEVIWMLYYEKMLDMLYLMVISKKLCCYVYD